MLTRLDSVGCTATGRHLAPFQRSTRAAPGTPVSGRSPPVTAQMSRADMALTGPRMPRPGTLILVHRRPSNRAAYGANLSADAGPIEVLPNTHTSAGLNALTVSMTSFPPAP